jgi:uncharacterized protein (DUF1697 family)
VPLQVAFLRGINVGRHGRVAMADVRDLLEGLAYEHVRTHLQSGNIVLASRLRPAQLERALEGQLSHGLGLTTRVFVRTRDELADVVARDPFGKLADDPSRYLVSFLDREPEPERLRELAAVDVSPERFVVSGRELYAWHPQGLQASQLAKLLAAGRLGVFMTGRNWNTVRKMLALAGS